MDYSQLDKELNRILGLDRPAVAIKFLTEEKNLESYDTSKQYTFCQFIMKAREGQKLMATGDNIACANGASALGFKLVPEKIINGDFLASLGTFTKEGARKTMQAMPRFELNRYSAIALSPLSNVDFDPDIIVLESKPEHIMWLTLAGIYHEGGRLSYSSSIANGTCVDVTVIPHLTQNINISLGCYGCRNATDIRDEHMLVGFPGSYLERLVNSLSLLEDKAMSRTRGKKAYKRLLGK